MYPIVLMKMKYTYVGNTVLNFKHQCNENTVSETKVQENTEKQWAEFFNLEMLIYDTLIFFFQK